MTPPLRERPWQDFLGRTCACVCRLLSHLSPAICGLSPLGWAHTLWELGVMLAVNLSHTPKGFHGTLGLLHQDLTSKLLFVETGAEQDNFPKHTQFLYH